MRERPGSASSPLLLHWHFLLLSSDRIVGRGRRGGNQVAIREAITGVLSVVEEHYREKAAGTIDTSPECVPPHFLTVFRDGWGRGGGHTHTHIHYMYVDMDMDGGVVGVVQAGAQCRGIGRNAVFSGGGRTPRQCVPHGLVCRD